MLMTWYMALALQAVFPTTLCLLLFATNTCSKVICPRCATSGLLSSMTMSSTDLIKDWPQEWLTSEHRQVAVEACWVFTNPLVTGSHVACILPVYRPEECQLSSDLRLLQVLQTNTVLPCLLRYKLHPVAAMQDGRFRLAPGNWYPHAPSLSSWDCPGIDSFCGGHRFEDWFQITWRNTLSCFEFIHKFYCHAIKGL